MNPRRIFQTSTFLYMKESINLRNGFNSNKVRISLPEYHEDFYFCSINGQYIRHLLHMFIKIHCQIGNSCFINSKSAAVKLTTT